jgi:hypothetical protein
MNTTILSLPGGHTTDIRQSRTRAFPVYVCMFKAPYPPRWSASTDCAAPPPTGRGPWPCRCRGPRPCPHDRPPAGRARARKGTQGHAQGHARARKGTHGHARVYARRASAPHCAVTYAGGPAELASHRAAHGAVTQVTGQSQAVTWGSHTGDRTVIGSHMGQSHR